MLSVEAMRFSYPGAAKQTLKGLDFEVEEGEIFGFLGPNGAGKSTTQNLLIGVLRGYEGSARVFGREVRDWGSEVYQQIGVAFEMPNHYARLSARENLDYFRGLYSSPTEEPMTLLGQVGLADAADQPVGSFSKGMKHRLTFARALLHRPKLLFLDEPTSGLDPANARNLKQIVSNLRDQGATIFLTTHNMTDADELCDRLALIADGELRAIDSPGALRLRHGRREVRLELEPEGDAAAAHGAEIHDFPLEGLGENETFLQLLRERRVRTLHSQEPSLEQVFLELTGRSLL